MNWVAFIGRSKSGKTAIVEKLVRELRRRGFSVAAVKHAPHGFSLDESGSDSWKFDQAGAEEIMAVSRERLFLQRKIKPQDTLSALIRRYFPNMDWVLLEGGKGEANIPKIEVLRKGYSEDLLPRISERIAVAADFDIKVSVPLIRSDDISKMADLLEEKMAEKKMTVKMKINGDDIPLNAFVQRMFSTTMQAMVSVLSGIPDETAGIEFLFKTDRAPELKVNQKSTRMNEFIQNYFSQVIQAMAVSLDDAPENPETIEFELVRK
jgi:molybdopterin-guanine dinucleotide biosynthesis adapter protein